MYALIYDEHDLSEAKKFVLSLHSTRENAENALEERKKELGKKVYRNATLVLFGSKKTMKAGGYVSSGQYANWRPGENIPHGEMYSDTD